MKEDKASELTLDVIEIYSDGAASPNPGRGGFGYVIRYLVNDENCNLEENIIEGAGGYKSTTNQRMEMMGAYAAIEYLCSVITTCKASDDKEFDAFKELRITSDSSYLCSGFTKGWVKNWKRKGWVKVDGKPVANQDMWESIDFGLTLLRTQFGISTKFIHVPGHKGWKFNEICDKLAVEARQKEDLMIDKVYENMYH